MEKKTQLSHKQLGVPSLLWASRVPAGYWSEVMQAAAAAASAAAAP